MSPTYSIPDAAATTIFPAFSWVNYLLNSASNTIENIRIIAESV